jgi:hypothetical protein
MGHGLAYRPPSTRMIGLPVRVMEISDRNRLPATLKAALRDARAARRGEAIVAICRLRDERCCASQLAMSRLVLIAMFGDARQDRASEDGNYRSRDRSLKSCNTLLVHVLGAASFGTRVGRASLRCDDQAAWQPHG